MGTALTLEEKKKLLDEMLDTHLEACMKYGRTHKASREWKAKVILLMNEIESEEEEA